MLRYAVAVFTAKLICANDKFNAFITIYGECGDSGQRRLHDSLAYSRPFAAAAAGQVDVFFIEAVHLGQLQHVLLECRSDGKGRIRSILGHAARCCAALVKTLLRLVWFYCSISLCYIV